MKPVREIYDEVLALSAQGRKPFQIVKQVLETASRSEVMLTGTLNRSELVFRTGEVIAFDGRHWHYRPGEPAAHAEETKKPRR
jgi:hypothetical protein